MALDSIKGVALVNRLDTKFVFGLPALAELLERIASDYLVVTINGARAQRYQTLYFDNTKLDLYLRHHNGVYPRHKVRCRRYVDSDVNFLEIKTKCNTGRTTKRRVRSPWLDAGITGEAAAFLQSTVPSLPSAISPVLQVDFTRLTLVDHASTERVTIDVDLSYRQGDRTYAFPNFVIAEVKRDRSLTPSGFLRQLRDLRLREGSISKYCLGIMSLYPNAKRNRFKQRLNEIIKLAA